MRRPAFREQVGARVGRYVSDAKAAVAKGEARFSGLERAKKLSVWHASSHAPHRTSGREATSRRRVSAATRGRLTAMLQALLEFRAQHRAAMRLMRAGLDTIFPAGTWTAWRYYGARRRDVIDGSHLCAGPAAAPC